MDPSSNVRADDADCLENAQAYLTRRLHPLHGPGPFHFELEKCTRGFDVMLKRNMVYARFGLGKVHAEASLAPSGSGLALTVSVPAHGTRFSDFLREIHPEWFSGQGPATVFVSGRSARLILAAGSPHRESLILNHASHASHGRTVPFLSASGRSLAAWLEGLFRQWSSSRGWRVGRERHRIWPSRRMDFFAWERISQIDVDSSHEREPHAFRWLERTHAARSVFATLDDAEIEPMLLAAGIRRRPGSHLTGKYESELSGNSACLALRFSHRLPDPSWDPGSDAIGAITEPGFVVMEDDFHEVQIDAAIKRVIGEAWKWRDPPP